jgi:hypothetical protein
LIIGEYLTIILINLICTGLNLLSPFLIQRIITFIESKDTAEEEALSVGFLYISALVASQGLYYFINEHLEFHQYLVGVKT